VPGIYDPGLPGISRGLRTWDFPDGTCPDPDNQTHASPRIDGLYPTHLQSGAASPSYSQAFAWNSPSTLSQVPYMPLTSLHTEHRSAGIPTTFPLQTNALTVNGVPQATTRGLRDFNAAAGKYPAQVWNINNAARNLLEIIADAARSDEDGDYPIRIYTIGMGELVRCPLGTRQEQSEELLKRVANDLSSPDYNDQQREGKYYFAATAEDVGPAFAALQNQIIRLTK
jgi:hypothetical protein